MRALVLNGGGSRGAFQAGVLHYLNEAKEPWYDVFGGNSVGAINAAYLAQFVEFEPASTGLSQLWRSIDNSSIMGRWFPFGRLHAIWKNSFYHTKPLKKLLKEHITPMRIKAAGNILRLGAVSLHTGEHKVFTEDYSDLREAIRASSALPIVFPPVELEHQLWVDGGVREMTPLAAVMKVDGVKEIDVIMSLQLNQVFDNKRPTNAARVGLQVLEAMTDEILNEDIEKAIYYNDCVQNGLPDGKGKRYVKIRIFQPTSDLPGNLMEFNSSDIDEMISIGHSSARRHFES